jgi:hypothetical protein
VILSSEVEEKTVSQNISPLCTFQARRIPWKRVTETEKLLKFLNIDKKRSETKLFLCESTERGFSFFEKTFNQSKNKY